MFKLKKSILIAECAESLTLLPWRYIAYLLIMVAFGLSVHAQESASSGVVGQVIDSAGAAVPDAVVRITNVGTSAERVTSTNQQGEFSISNLPPAQYRMRIEKTGFEAALVKAFDLRVGEIARESVSLAIGSVQQAVEVTAEAAQLQTDTATVSQVMNGKEISDLPLNGRNLLQLGALSAGSAPRSNIRNGVNGGSATHYGERNLYITVEGGRDSDTNYVIDGVYVRSLVYNNLSLRPSVDTIQEFNLLRNSFSAEYGQGGAVVTMVTKSGTNDLHGNAFEFLRNSLFDSKNFFATPGALLANNEQKPTLRRNQFGGTLGGPIVKNKVFLFGGYEELRNTQQRIQLGTSPTLAQLPRNLTTSDYTYFASLPQSQWPIDPLTGLPFPAGIIPNNRISPFAKALASVVTAPSPGLATANNFGFVSNFIDNYETATFRSDQILSPKHSLFERYIWYDSAQFTPDPTTFGADSYPQGAQNVSVGDIYILSPSMVNEFHIGYNRSISFAGPVPQTKNWDAAAGLQNIPGATNLSLYGEPVVNVTGYSSFGDKQFNEGARENVFSLSESLSNVFGKHTLHYGVQVSHRLFYQEAAVPPRGSFSFTGQGTNPANRTIAAPGLGPNAMVSSSSSPLYSISDFLLGICQACSAGIGDGSYNYTDNTFGIFINDVWQIHPRLTLNWGLRWEYLGPFGEVNGLEANFNPATGQIGYHTVPQNLPPGMLAQNLVSLQNGAYPAGIEQPDYRNFAPRAGLAYRITDKTMIRAGGGVYFDNPNIAELQFTSQIEPFYYNYAAPAFQFTSNMFPNVNSLTTFPGPWSIGENNRNPYTTQWNFSIQRELPGHVLFEIAYSGSETHKEHKRQNINQSLPVNAAVNPFYFGPPGKQTIPYPQFQQSMLASYNIANASYEGLTTKVEKSFSHGLYFLANFQYSKSIDDGSGEIEGNDDSVTGLAYLDRAVSRFSQKFRSTGSFVYELPFGRGKTYLKDGAAANILGNWQIQGTISMYSGFYFTPTGPNTCQCVTAYGTPRANITPGITNYGNLGSAATPNEWFNPAAFSIPLSGYQGNAGRDKILGPGFQDIDISLAKTIGIRERANLQIRAEAFNVLNHPILGPPIVDISQVTAGQITTTVSDNRSLQFGLKLTF